MKAPFDHAPYDVEDIEKDKVDRRRGERVSPREDFACFCLADGLFGQQATLKDSRLNEVMSFRSTFSKTGWM